jgi:hypothetical protein
LESTRVSPGTPAAAKHHRPNLSLAGRSLEKVRAHTRILLSALALFLAFAQTWTTRGVLGPDGISYSDIAKAYLRGDWHNALNSYWSPLYSWLLAIGYVVFRPSMRWEPFVSHAINFLSFLGALLAWNWLLNEWERWQGPPRHRILVEVAAFSVITWAGLHLVGLAFSSADMIVLALTFVLAAVLVRVRRGAAGTADFIVMGLALGFGFLAKAGFQTLIPLILGETAILLHSIRDRRLYLAAALTALISLPFIAALSIDKGHFVVNDSGRVNYSAAVTGMSLEGWKQEQYWPGSKARHPFTILLDHPRVLGYESHLVGTTPVHYDPSWWWEGVPDGVNWPRQLMVIWSNIGYCVTRFALCPALILAIVCVLWGAGPRMLRVIGETWFIWAPALIALSVYCLVYTLTRYVAGGFCLLAFCVIACGWRVRLPRWIAAAAAALILLACFVGRWREFIQVPRAFVQDMIGRGDPQELTDITIAEKLKEAGLQPGDRVALIGNSINAAWLSLLGGTTVATVPETIGFDDRTFGRKQTATHEKSDAFWSSDARVKQQVFDAFRRVGAKWVVASNVPNWANTAGWNIAGYAIPWVPAKEKHAIFYRRLN